MADAMSLAVNGTAECPPAQNASDACTPPAKGAKKGKQAKAVDLAGAADMNATDVAVNATAACPPAASPEECAAAANVKGAKGKKVKAADPAAAADLAAAADKKGGKAKNKDAVDVVAMNNATNLDAAAADNSTLLVASMADCGMAMNATAMDACNMMMANGTALNDTAADSMMNAMSHVKNAKAALALMMAGDEGANMDQVNGNVTLAVDEMGDVMMMSCVFFPIIFFSLSEPQLADSNATGKGMMKSAMSMAQGLKMDAKAMGDACASA